MYKKGTGNDKQGKDAGNRTLCPYRNFCQAIKRFINLHKHSPLRKVMILKLAAYREIDYPKIAKIRLVKFELLTSKYHIKTISQSVFNGRQQLWSQNIS